MMRIRARLPVAAFMLLSMGIAGAQAPESTPTRVTVDNFIRAETDMYFANAVKDAGGIGKMFHHREMMSIDKQTVIRSNRDTLYSSAVFDLDAGPVTITLPDAGSRFRSLMAVNQDHYIVGKIEYGAGSYNYDKKNVGTRYLLLGLRAFADPSDPKDLKTVYALQDTTHINQKNAGKFDIPTWDPTSQKLVRDALLVLGSTTSGFAGAFGSKAKVDPIHHLIGTALGWGGNPPDAAIYFGENPAKNDGKTIYKLTVKDVPVDGFWSVSVYNANGYFTKNALNAYSLNNLTAKTGADGSYEIQFGGCGATPNCLPIVDGWNYTVRLYRPRAEIVSGAWKFPKAVPVK